MRCPTTGTTGTPSFFASSSGEILIPSEKTIELVKGQKRTTSRKMFPGYLFVEMDLSDETWHIVQNTPKITTLPQYYKLPGRDHWGSVQTVFVAGGGVRGGAVVGSSDRIGGYPKSDPQTPENLAATIYDALGIPSAAMWTDAQDRPHHIYHGRPIAGLM